MVLRNKDYDIVKVIEEEEVWKFRVVVVKVFCFVLRFVGSYIGI